MGRALLWVAGTAVVVTALGRLRGDRSRDANLVDYYTVSGDGRTLHLTTIAGDGAWTRVTNLRETASTVEVEVKSFRWPFVTGSDIGRELELSIVLESPIGNRVVTDGLHEVPPR